jgi:hypothetical protein
VSQYSARWIERLSRVQATDEQCGACRYWVPREGALATDWGACTNEASPFDGVVRFEHDGCEAYADAGEWIQPLSQR